MKVSQSIVESLKQAEVPWVFGVGGSNIEDLYDAVFRHGDGMRALVAKHEFSAGTMADAYARVTGRLGVVVATSGGGAFNLVPALAEAFASSVPILAIVGQAPSHLDGNGSFQDSSGKSGSIDAEKVFGGVTKFCRRVKDSKQIGALLDNAIENAQCEPQGPSVLLIPKDLQCAEVPDSRERRVASPEPRGAVPGFGEVLRAAHALSECAGQILLVCGEGVSRAQAQPEIARLASLLDASVAVTAGGKNAFDHFDPRFAGVTGVMGHRSVSERMERARACLLIGTRMSAISRYGLEKSLGGKPLVLLSSLDPYPAVPSEKCIHLKGSVRETARTLLAHLADRAPRSHADGPLVQYEAPGSIIPGAAESTLYEFVQALEGCVESPCNWIIDAGNAAAACVHRLKIRSDSGYCLALGMGGMGFSFGGAVGAALGNGRRTYVVAGDGAFFMHGSEIHTAVELGLPITYLIFDNSAHGMCVTRESLYFQAHYSYNRFKRSEIAAGLGAMYPGLRSIAVNTAQELREALAALRGSENGPAIVVIRTNVEEIPPFIPFLDQQRKLQGN